MWAIFALSATAIVLPAPGGRAAPLSELWSLDKETVMVGGCVTINIEDACRSMPGLTLTIGDRSSIPLLERAGITIQYTTGPGAGKTHTLVVISHDFTNPEGIEIITEHPLTYRMVPVFRKPGSVELRLDSDERPLGAKVLQVLPPTPDAEAALELLYPVIVRKDGATPQSARVVQLLSTPTYGDRPRVGRDELEHFHSALNSLRQHPDWAEIFGMLVARLEARVNFNELREYLRGRAGEVIEESELPRVSEAVEKALEKKVKSPFAKAVQDGIRHTVGLRKSLLDPDHPMRRWDE